MAAVLLSVGVAALCVGAVAFTVVQYRAEVRAGRLEPMASRSTPEPTDRNWRYWLLPDFRRGECWPLGYWVTVLAVLLGLAVMAWIGGSSAAVPIFVAVGVPVIPAIRRRVRYGFQGPRRRAATPG